MTSAGVRADGGPSRARLALLLALVGSLLLAHPVYLWPHYGQTQVGLRAELRADETAEVAFSELPPAAQAAFRDAVAGEPVELWSGEDDAAIEAFEERPTVGYRGDTYQAVLYVSHAGSFVPVFLRWLLTAASAALVAYAALVWSAGSWRPLTPRRSLWVSVAVVAAFIGTAAYDVWLSGAAGSVWTLSGDVPGLELLLMVPITSLFVPVGSVAATDGIQSPGVAAGTVAVLVLAYARFLHGFVPVSVAILTAYTAVGGVVWAALGYRLTAGV